MTQPEGHLVTPKSNKCAGVLIVHSWWGLNQFFRKLCQRFADAGYVALAADLYGGKTAKSKSATKRLRAKIASTRKEPAYKYLIRMIKFLSEHKQVATPKIAVVGFSMGEHWAYWLSQRPDLPIVATTTFYAARGGDYSQSSSSFLGHFAETDEWVSPAAVEELRGCLERADRDFEFHTYPGTSHWFFERDHADVFDSAASDLAWKRTIKFLDKTLKPNLSAK